MKEYRRKVSVPSFLGEGVKVAFFRFRDKLTSGLCNWLIKIPILAKNRSEKGRESWCDPFYDIRPRKNALII